MKYFLFVCFIFINITVKSQPYNRETNNNKIYIDSTANAEINAIHELVKDGDNFNEIAIKYSQDPGSYKEGGKLEPSTMEKYVEEFKNVVLKLSPSEISKPFKTEYGYHIVKLISKKDGLYITRHILLRVD